MQTQTISRAEQIARLNDRVRRGLDRNARIMFTGGFSAKFFEGNIALAMMAQASTMKAIRKHEFTDDAHGERDFGEINYRGQRVWFKIDYYDTELEYGSEDPADASVTRRVMTIMLPEDY